MPTQTFIIVHAVINMKPAHRNMLYSLDLLAQKAAYLTKKIHPTSLDTPIAYGKVKHFDYVVQPFSENLSLQNIYNCRIEHLHTIFYPSNFCYVK